MTTTSPKMDDSGLTEDNEVLFGLVMSCEHDERHQALALRTWLPRIKEWHRKSALRQDSSGGEVLEALKEAARRYPDNPAVAFLFGAIGPLEPPSANTLRIFTAPQESRSEVLELTVKLLREIVRRHPAVRQDTDVEAFIMNELNPALASRAEPGAPQYKKF